MNIRLTEFFSTAVFISGILVQSANAAPDDTKLYDRDGVPGLSLEEYQVYLLHQNNPTFAKYDKNYDGKISGAEAAAMNKDATNFSASALPYYRSYFKQKYGSAGSMPVSDAIDGVIPKDVDGCGSQQGLYVRRDKADISVYSAANVREKKGAKGASLSYTHDALTDEDSANLNGVATWIVARNPCRQSPDGRDPKGAFISAYALAPYVSASGVLKSDGTGKSSLRAGIDGQVSLFSGALFDNQYLTVSPYYQTDLQLKGSGYGLTATYEPYLLRAYLGGRVGRPKYLDFYWQALFQTDLLHVVKAGATDMTDGRNYSWLGGTLKAHLGILPEMLDDRLYADIAYNRFWDASSSLDISSWNAELGFNLTPEGDTSVSLEYEDGTTKDTLESAKTVTLNLNYKF